MTKLKNYRVTQSRSEIISLLEKKQRDGQIFLVWQRDPKTKERSFLIEVKIDQLDSIEAKITLTLTEQELNKFKIDWDVYFLLKDEDFAFKTKFSIEKLKSKVMIHLQIPKEVRLKEKRSSSRVVFKNNETFYVEASFDKKNEPGQIHITCPVINISNEGICLLVNKDTFCLADLKARVTLAGMTHINKNIKQKMAYIKNARKHSQKKLSIDETYALGMIFVHE